MSMGGIHPRDPSKDGPPKEQADRRLESWKEISAYLGRSERTVRRWEETEELPVHRHHHEKRGSVYAYASELDAWRQSRSHLGSYEFNSAGEPLSTVAAEARAEGENDESPGKSLRVRLLLKAAIRRRLFRDWRCGRNLAPAPPVAPAKHLGLRSDNPRRANKGAYWYGWKQAVSKSGGASEYCSGRHRGRTHCHNSCSSEESFHPRRLAGWFHSPCQPG